MSIVHDKLKPIIDEMYRVCKEVDAEAIIMFAGEDISSGGSVHLNPEFQRFRTFHTPLYRNERVFDRKNSHGYSRRSSEIHPAQEIYSQTPDDNRRK